MIKAFSAPVRVILKPLTRFLNTQNLGSKLLLIATFAALLIANSPLQEFYDDIWNTLLSFSFGSYTLSHSFVDWINDGLMVIFFFVIGLEIKREILVGELSQLRKASLPLIAAIGGMLVPAIIFLAFNIDKPGVHGWGIPMATDIAFALGCLMVLNDRLPISLKVFLLALAIVDDIGAILVIAFFYTSELSLAALMVAGIIIGFLILLNYLNVRDTAPFAVLGFFLWLAFLQSGIHATLAGVLLAFTIPARTVFKPEEFIAETGKCLENFPNQEFRWMAVDTEQRQAIKTIDEAVKKIDTPLQRMEDTLHPVAAYVILPLFALANAGINFLGGPADHNIINPVSLGIILGLFLGKQLGIMLFSYLGFRLGIADLPEGANWKGIYGISCLAGIGFTMSLFITNLAFNSPELIYQAKIGILTASFVSAVFGLIILLVVSGVADQKENEKLLE